METASKRLSAKELILDPFLIVDDIDDQVLKSIGNQKPFLNDHIGMEDLLSNEDVQKTNMTITGKLNPEDDTIFLKVQIADKEGIMPSIFMLQSSMFLPIIRILEHKVEKILVHYLLLFFRCCKECIFSV